jgi:NADPH-dependent glutamate synthase beta subunit-like oxidoreductase/NAD-dependent dihydropyrimidine dehydrogenase PreA subunit
MIQQIDPQKCTGCGICVSVCPLDTLRLAPFQETYPPCRQRCPAGVDVRGFLFYFKQGMLDEAYAFLHEFLPFPAITGLLCHHPCEKACARNAVDQAINIHGIEYYFGRSSAYRRSLPLPLLHPEKIAVIGSGPAGLSAAYFMRKMGYTVTVFESDDRFGGALLKEVSEKRLPLDILNAEVSSLERMGISFVNRSKLFKVMKFNDLWDQRYSAVCLAPGIATEFTDQIPTDDKKHIIPDPVTLETKVDGVFACGGAVTGNLSIVDTIAHGKRAAVSMDRFLRKEVQLSEKGLHIKKVKRIPRDGIRKEARLDPAGGLNDLSAAMEAQRCMSCGSLAYIAHPEDCMTCFECEVKCPSNAIKVHPFKEILPMTLAIK